MKNTHYIFGGLTKPFNPSHWGPKTEAFHGRCSFGCGNPAVGQIRDGGFNRALCLHHGRPYGLSVHPRHSHTPWEMTLSSVRDGRWCLVSENRTIAVLGGPQTRKFEDHRNGQFIVLAVNSHEALIEALDLIVDDVENLKMGDEGENEWLRWRGYKKAKAALAAAKEESS